MMGPPIELSAGVTWFHIVYFMLFMQEFAVANRLISRSGVTGELLTRDAPIAGSHSSVRPISDDVRAQLHR
jgi:hypothetical protein